MVASKTALLNTKGILSLKQKTQAQVKKKNKGVVCFSYPNAASLTRMEVVRVIVYNINKLI